MVVAGGWSDVRGRKIDRWRLFVYGVLPFSIGVAFVVLYFSGVEFLQTLASPLRQRELGLIENFQNLLLILAVVVSLRAVARERDRRWKWFWWIAGALCMFVLLEEIDWGDHYWRALNGQPPRTGEFFNLHNRSNITGWPQAARRRRFDRLLRRPAVGRPERTPFVFECSCRVATVR